MPEVDDTSTRKTYATPKLLGVVIAFLGGSVLISWYLNTLELVTVPTQWVPMQYNTAVGFVFTGMAVVAHCIGRRRLAFACGVVAAGIGSVALAEQIMHREFRLIDLLFLSNNEGRHGLARNMAPNTALCFSIAGCLILVYSAPRSSRRWREMTGGVLAAVLASAGFVGLWGYIISDDLVEGWARFTHMDVHIALAFVGLGVAFFAMVGQFRGTVDRRLPGWAPWAAGLGVATLIVAVWVGLTSSEGRLRSIAATKSHDAAISHVNQSLQSNMRELNRLAMLFAHLGSGMGPHLASDVNTLANDLPGLVSLMYLDPRSRVLFSRGPEGPKEKHWEARLIAEPTVGEVLTRARVDCDAAVSVPTRLSDGLGGLFICLPVERGGEVRGFLLTQHSVKGFFDAVFADGVARNYDVELSADESGAIFYRSYDPYSAPRRLVSNRQMAADATGRVALGDQIWTIRGAADPTLLAGGKSVSNALVLWVGMFLAVAIAFVVRKSQLLQQRAESLAEANQVIEKHADSLRRANSELEEQAQHLRNTDERLRRAAREKRRVLDSLSAFLIGIDEDGIVTEWNFVSSELFGVRSSETLGKRFGELDLPWDRDAVQAAIDECQATGERVRRDGFGVNREDEEEGRVASFTVNPTQDSARRGVSIIGADVTERQILEMQLHHAQKLESVGTLAAGIAHEINTPMQFVSDNVRFLSQSVGPITGLLQLVPELLNAAKEHDGPPELIQRVEEVVEEVDVDFMSNEMPLAVQETLEGIDRVTTIVHAMKDFSHPGSDGVAYADINKAIETTLAVARNEYKYYAQIETDFGDLPLVECWVADLNQVFLNLLVNATHAIRDKLGENSGRKGTITVSTRLDGDDIEVRLTDTGIGIPEDLQAKIFDQFFTTKEIGVGTGLGLAIARSVVVEKHSGNIFFETRAGEGTTFVVRIPVKQEITSANDPVR